MVSIKSKQQILGSPLLRTFLFGISLFLLGIIVGRYSSLFLDDDDGYNQQHHYDVFLKDSKNKNNNDNTPHPEEGSTLLTRQHSMSWKVPADIAKERHEECEGKKTASTGGFCLTRRRSMGGNHIYDRSLAEYLAKSVFAGYTVVDLGAGLGHYGTIFRESSSLVQEWVGYDGAMNVQSATDGMVRYMDLTQPHAADERPCLGADWVLSLEVAEHIPTQYTDAYLRNVRCRAKVGAVLSWATPDQGGGLGHVNMKTEENTIAAVEKWGFAVDWELTKATREHATEAHFRKNIIVYKVI